ncbi:hypothetical protein Goklo_015796 [Gossypium klotzschianum]|uniref:Uncharacterized protein n=1 Tax=Gossypium klotzschianum TaxID=34286 RepID=A0A7J8UC52_9ROSI|nr:hypothetical protein [Gossypium klotzschianum]
MNITGMSEQWVTAQIKQKGESKCIPRKSLRDLILAHPDTKKKELATTLRHDDITEERWMAILQNL